MSKYLIVLILFIVAFGGWYLWHKKDADFFNAWVGSFTCITAFFSALIFLFFA